MCPRRRVEIGQEYLKAQRKGDSFFFLTYQRMVSPSAIRNKTGGKRICCRFRSINALVEQERPELCQIGNRRGLPKSDDGCYSQRRSANKRRSDRVCQRIRSTRDSKASQIYTAVLSLGKRCEDHGYSQEWTSGQKPQLIKDGRRTKCNTENYVPIVVPGLSTGSSSSATPTSPTSLPQDQHGETCRMNQQRPQNTNKNADNETVRGEPVA